MSPFAPAAPFSHLWRHARNAVALVWRALSAPGRDAKAAKALRARVNAAASFVRKLVLIEAQARPYVFGARRPPAPRRAQKSKPGKAARASFRLWPRRAPEPARISALGAPTLTRQIWAAQSRRALIARLKAARLARAIARLGEGAYLGESGRLEAKMRGLNALMRRPALAIRRLQRRLKRDPRLCVRIAVSRLDRLDPLDAEARREVESRAFLAARAFCDNSS